MMNDPYSFCKKAFDRELDNILSWWANNMLDEEGQGFIGRIDGSGIKHPGAPRGIVMYTRILWSFAAAVQSVKIAYLPLAKKAYQYIIDHFLDRKNGGLYWMVDKSGYPLDKKKQIYAQAFGIYAFATYYQCTGEPEALQIANQIFLLIEKHAHDHEKRGYLEAMTEDWHWMEDVRLSDKEANDKKTMNTHLHLLECFTQLYKVDQRPLYAQALEDLIILYKNKFVDLKTGRLKLFFDEDWNENLTHHSYGHEIESVWLMNEAAEVLGNQKLKESVIDVSLQIAERVIKEGVDGNGAIYNEKSLEGQYHPWRDWWPQAEGVIGFYDAFQKTGKKVYKQASEKCWNYIQQFIIDHNNGEWYWACDQQGRPIITEDKAGPWKAPYHNSRMCMEMINRLENDKNE